MIIGTYISSQLHCYRSILLCILIREVSSSLPSISSCMVIESQLAMLISVSACHLSVKKLCVFIIFIANNVVDKHAPVSQRLYSCIATVIRFENEQHTPIIIIIEPSACCSYGEKLILSYERPVTANLFPPKIGPPDQKWQPILVPPDQLWVPYLVRPCIYSPPRPNLAANIVPPRPHLASKIDPPRSCRQCLTVPHQHAVMPL